VTFGLTKLLMLLSWGADEAKFSVIEWGTTGVRQWKITWAEERIAETAKAEGEEQQQQWQSWSSS
jgi:hypothetical protein